MAVFSYRAVTAEGSVFDGVIEAPDERSAAEKIKDAGSIPIRITAPVEAGAWRRRERPSSGGLLVFNNELSALLGAGLPLDRSLNVLAEVSESRSMRGVIRDLVKSVREGSSFSDALRKHPNIFPRLYVSMVRAGESGGVLEAVLDKLDEFLESSKELKDNVITAMIYPLILVMTGGVSIAILLIYVLPNFTAIFEETGTVLPLQTRVLMGASVLLKSYWWAMFVAAALLPLAARSWIRTASGRRSWDALKLKILGDVVVKLETARFARTLGTLLKNGVPLLQALGNTKDVIGNTVMAASIDKVVEDVKVGKGIAASIAATGYFPPFAVSMIRVGEESGQLDGMLLEVASAYEKGLKVAVKRFIGLLEPALILIMGLVIGFIVVSMMMAVFGLTEVPF